VSARLTTEDVERLLAGVDAASAAAAAAWPGTPERRQPVQVLYVPADRITATTATDAGHEAARLLATHAATPAALAAATGSGATGALAEAVHERVATKLATEPVEDLRVDFEDGYLGRDEATEAADAEAAARAIGRAVLDGTAPPFHGLRVKSFSDGLARRSVATLDRYLATLLDTVGHLPDGFVVTFPKIMARQHVEAFVDVLAALEQAHGLDEGVLGLEAQVETTASLLGPDGTVVLRGLREAAAGRLRAAHVGVFDLTAALGLPAEQQRLDHPALDHARHLLQVTFAGTEVLLSDGSTNLRPGDDSSAEVHRVWATHAAHVRHSLAHGWVQGWDMHPSHLVSRYATVHAHLLDGLDDVLDRLAAWHGGRHDGATMDEPATVKVLQRQVRRAVACGAIDADVAAARTNT